MSKTIQVSLESNPLVFVPGMVEYCSCGYRTARTKKERERFVQIILRGWNLPQDVVVDLLTGKIDWNADGTSVVFRVEAGRMAPRN